MSFLLKFNNVEIPSFIRVLSVNTSILPAITHRKAVIPNHFGNVDGGIEFGSKTFNIKIIIVKDSKTDDEYYTRELAKWLRGDNFNISKLELDDTGKYYKARCTDAVDIEDLVLYGTGTLVFTASDPRRYNNSITKQTVYSTGQTNGNTSIDEVAKSITFNCIYAGDINALPKYTITFDKACTNVKIANTTLGLTSNITNSFKAGDVLVVDNITKKIKLNDADAMELFNVDGDFTKIQEGKNIIVFTFTGNFPKSIVMEYTAVYF